MVIDDLSRPWPDTPRGTRWQVITDGVMGGLSQARAELAPVAGRAAIHMTGRVSTANNGGFVQIALDLCPGGEPVDASGFAGIAVMARGNGRGYGLHLRTDAVQRPWQSYRLGFDAGPDWQVHRLFFGDVRPHRLTAPFDPARLRRIGLVAIGGDFDADLAVSDLRFFP